MTTKIRTRISMNRNGPITHFSNRSSLIHILLLQIWRYQWMGSEFHQPIHCSRRNVVRCHHGRSLTESNVIQISSLVFQAANYLGIKTLLAVGCKTIANMVRGKSSSEVRDMFNISHDPPGEGLNAQQTGDAAVGTVPTTPDANTAGPSPLPDPMK